MNKLRKLSSVALALGAGMLWPAAVNAQYGGGDGGGAAPAPAADASTDGAKTITDASGTPVSPLISSGYISMMGSYQKTFSDSQMSNGYGGQFMLGYRAGIYALETGIGVTTDSGVLRGSVKVRGLVFPFSSIPVAYGLIGAGLSDYNHYDYPISVRSFYGPRHFETLDLNGGLGYMFPLHSGNYDYAIRAEVVYELGDRFLERESDFVTDISAPSTFHHLMVNIGLQLPTKANPPPPPPPEPAVVVPPPQDSDGDGVIDEKDQCPGTPHGTPVDDKGCPLPPPPPPCKTPEPGEKVSLSGCATGETIVLRGVNFEFDKSKLTTNAKTILDGVADELAAYPSIMIELSGHTDSKGSDSYNQKLSEARAKSVVAYLQSKGIDSSRMTAVGYGETQPVADNNTDAGRELNRRVELKVTASNGASATSTGANAPATMTVPPAAPEGPAAPEAAPAADAAPAAPAAEAAPADAGSPSGN